MKKLHLEKFLLVLLIIPLFGCCSLFSNNCIVVNTNVYEIEEKEDSRFNSEFFKYYENGKDVLKVTPHDIVSIANFEKENN